MAAKKLMYVHHALEYSKKLDVSSQDDLFENEDLISMGRLVIVPANDEGDRDIDEDAGDQNELLPNNLNQN